MFNWGFLHDIEWKQHQTSSIKNLQLIRGRRNLVAVGYPTAVFVSDLSYFALFATKTKPHYVEMVLIVVGGEVAGRVKRAG